MAAYNAFKHSYSVLASWGVWKPIMMKAMQSEEEQGLYETEIKIGPEREEEFQFMRDADPNQTIYPARTKATDPEVPVRGPDHRGKGKNWIVSGKMGEAVKIQL